MTDTPVMNQPKRGLLRRVLRGAWIALCMLAGAAIAGVLIGAWASNLWVGVGAAVPGAAVGFAFGRYISPFDIFLHA